MLLSGQFPPLTCAVVFLWGCYFIKYWNVVWNLSHKCPASVCLHECNVFLYLHFLSCASPEAKSTAGCSRALNLAYTSRMLLLMPKRMFVGAFGKVTENILASVSVFCCTDGLPLNLGQSGEMSFEGEGCDGTGKSTQVPVSCVIPTPWFSIALLAKNLTPAPGLIPTHSGNLTCLSSFLKDFYSWNCDLGAAYGVPWYLVLILASYIETFYLSLSPNTGWHGEGIVLFTLTTSEPCRVWSSVTSVIHHWYHFFFFS